jgi:hypothetical protein
MEQHPDDDSVVERGSVSANAERREALGRAPATQ